MEIESWDDKIADIVDITLAGKNELSSAAAQLSQICHSDEKKEFLLDYVWIESFHDRDETSERIQDLIGRLVESNTLSIASVIGLLEVESVPKDVITSDSLRRKRTQAKTKKFYTIPKYNLLSECAEGFSVVIDIAWSCGTHTVDSKELPIITWNLKEAIGHYNLCPNKVLVILLSVLCWVKEEPNASALVAMVKELFTKERVTSVLAFHALSFSKSEEGPGETPRGFVKAISRLSAAGLVNVSEVWSVLTPTIPEISEKVSIILSEYEKQMDVVGKSLAGSLAEVNEGEISSPESKFSACISSISKTLGESARFILLEELMRSSQWEFANPLLSHLQNLFGNIPLAAIENIREVLLESIESAAQSFMDTGEQTSWLRHLFTFTGVYVGSGSAKVLAYLFEMVSRSDSRACTDLLAEYLLPALCVSTPNPYLAALAWECMRTKPPAERFLIYQRWERGYTSIFPLGLVKQIESVQTKALLKRVVKAAQVGDIVSRTSHLAMAKIACCNPLIGISFVVSNIQIHFNYNLIEPYVEVLSKLPALAQDVTSYLIAISLVSDPKKPPLHLKTASVEPWLSNLSEFAGRFYKWHPWTPLDGIMRLVVACMVRGEVTEGRVFLEALIEHMGGLSMVQQLNAEQLESIAGGPILNSLMTMSSKLEGIKVTERARLALKEALLTEPALVQTLLTCLCKQLNDLTTDHKTAQELMVGGGGLKLLGILYDGIHTCFLQLTQFLAQACSLEEYGALLNPSNFLISSDMDPSLAFHISRPAGGNTHLCQNVAISTNVSNDLCAVFWNLSLYDITFPENSYCKQIQILKEKIQSQEQQVFALERVRTDDAKEQFRTAKRDLARLKDSLVKLESEFSLHANRYKAVLEMLQEKKNHWWTDGIGNRASTLFFVEELVAKRVRISVQDALFCSHFIKWIAKENVVGFQFLDFMNQWTELLSQLVSSASEGEIRTFSEFVLDIMKFVVDMRLDESMFSQFVTSVNPVFNRNYYSPDKGEILPITQSELKRGHLKWESSLAKSLKSAMGKDTADWCEKRNCLILISKTCQTFPIIQTNASDLLKAIQDLTSDSQEDIATLALSLSRKLASLEPNWLDKTLVESALVVEKLESPDPAEIDNKKPKAPIVSRPRRDREDSPQRTIKRPARGTDLDEYGPKRTRPDERERINRGSLAPAPRHRAAAPRR